MVPLGLSWSVVFFRLGGSFSYQLFLQVTKRAAVLLQAVRIERYRIRTFIGSKYFYPLCDGKLEPIYVKVDVKQCCLVQTG